MRGKGVAMNFLVKTCDYERMNSERMAARVFVVLGSVAWAFLFIASYFAYKPSAGASLWQLVLPLVLAVAALGLGWFYERVAALLLFAGGVAAIVWGLAMGWEAGVWGLMSLTLIAPTLLAGLLFLLAAETQSVCELEEASRKS